MYIKSQQLYTRLKGNTGKAELHGSLELTTVNAMD